MPRLSPLLLVLLLPLALQPRCAADDAPVAEQLRQADEAAREHAAAQARLSESEAKLKELEQALAKLKSDIELKQKEVADNEAALKMQQEEAAATQTAKVESEKAASAAQAALEEAQKKAEEAKAAVAAATEAEGKTAAEVATSQQMLTGLHEMLAAAQTSINATGEQLASLQTELQSARELADAAKADWLAKARTVEAALAQSGQWVSFRAEVAPILYTRCLACHNARTAKGRLNMESYAALMKGGESGAVFDPADVENSNLHSLISDGSMPKDAEPLAAEQIATLDKWMRLGGRLDAGVEAAAPLINILPRLPQPAAPENYSATFPVTAVAFNPDGQIIATSGYHELLLWNAADQKLIHRFGNVAERVFDMAFAPDGSKIAVAAGTPGQWGELKVFQTSDGALLADLVTVDDAMLGVAFSPDGSRLAGCGADRSLSVYDVATWTQQLRLEDHADWVLDVAWSPDGSKLVTASRDKTSKVFDAATGDAVATFNGHGDVVFSAGFLADSAQVVSAGRDRHLRVWTAADAKQVREIGGFGGDVVQIQVLPDNRVFSASGDQHVRLHNAADGALIRDFTGHTDWVYCVSASPGANRVAAGSYDGEVRIWNIETGEAAGQWLAAPGYQAAPTASR